VYDDSEAPSEDSVIQSGIDAAKKVLEQWDGCISEGFSGDFVASGDCFEDAWIMAKSTEFPETIVTLFAGMGGVEHGAKMAGLPTAYSGEMWMPAIRINEANNPEADHHQVEFGVGEEGSIPAVAERILRAVGNRKYHLHGSPPCQGDSIANRKANIYTGEKKGIDLVKWFHDLKDFMYRTENPPVSWTMEEVHEVARSIQDVEGISDDFKRLARETPFVYARDHGLAQHRKRMLIGQHGDKDIILPPSVDKPITLRDVFPGAEQQFIENTARRHRELDRMKENWPDAIDSEEKRQYLRDTPLINFGDATNPGRGGAKWREGGGNFTYKKLYELGQRGSSLTGKRPTYPYDRKFTNQELQDLAGYKNYDLEPPGGKISLEDMAQMFGNSVPPPLAGALFRHLLSGDSAVS
jgi:site-specific DNA-cytosine methylase